MDDIAELFLRVGQGDAVRAREIVRFRPELARACDAHGLSVLQFARYMGEQAIFDALIAAGPPLSIFEAASLDRVDRVSELLASDRGLHRIFDSDGQSPLHLAAAAAANGAIRVLLNAGAAVDLHAQTPERETALHVAARRRHADTCRLLLRSGADPNARRADGATPLMIAAAQNERELVEMLVARNANVEARDSAGRTAVDVAAAAGNPELAARLRLQERVIDRAKA